MTPIKAKKALFIKLGQKDSYKTECIDQGLLQIGYHEVPHHICLQNDWNLARSYFKDAPDIGSITRHINQLQKFYEEPDDTLWITFIGNQMYWGFAEPEVTESNNLKTRRLIGGWKNSDLSGNPLLKNRLSGKLLAVQGFQGTICSIKELDYLLHKINGTFEPHVEKAEQALRDLIDSLVPIIKNLHPKDLEILTDLIFRQAGWQRTGVSGETEKDIDLDLQSPITQERIAIQVKSKATKAIFDHYKKIFQEDMQGFTKVYFVTHSPDLNLDVVGESKDNFFIWDAQELAKQATYNGLTGWLVDKAS